MRKRKDIEAEILERGNSGREDLLVEILLDIRDLLEPDITHEGTN